MSRAAVGNAGGQDGVPQGHCPGLPQVLCGPSKGSPRDCPRWLCDCGFFPGRATTSTSSATESPVKDLCCPFAGCAFKVCTVKILKGGLIYTTPPPRQHLVSSWTIPLREGCKVTFLYGDGAGQALPSPSSWECFSALCPHGSPKKEETKSEETPVGQGVTL